MMFWSSNSTKEDKVNAKCIEKIQIEDLEKLQREEVTKDMERLKKLEKEINSRQSVKSIIKEIRHDYKDKFVPFGEFIDNSFDWGKANHVKVILHKNKIIVIDNGNGIKSERLEKTLIFGSENENVEKGTIGKLETTLVAII